MEKEVCVCVAWDRNTDVCKTGLHLSLALSGVGIKTFVLPSERWALQRFSVARGNFHSKEVKCTFCTFYKQAAALHLCVQHETAAISALSVLLNPFN